MEIHKLPIKFTRHVILMLNTRFRIYSTKEVIHTIKSASMIRRPEKEGDIGIFRSKQMQIVFTIRNKKLWIITVEEVTK